VDSLDALKQYLTRLAPVPDEEWTHFAGHLKLRKINRGERYFNQGDALTEIGFVAQGLLYSYYTNAEGEEFVKYFIPEGGMVAGYTYLLKGTPAGFTSQAIEDSLILGFPYSKFQKLFERHPCWDRVVRLVNQRLYLEKDEREQFFLMMDAKARYEAFMKNRGDLPQRIPQYLIASYIGISPVSLSRIRKGQNP
jgi:CRP-like cAMP-binding protein